MQDVYYEPDTTQTMLHITDYTSNALFLPNDLDDYPNGERIKFILTAFAPERQKQISHLKQGQRVFLRNVRVKCGISSDLEGDIGARGNFAVTLLYERDAAYQELEKAYVRFCCGSAMDWLTSLTLSRQDLLVCIAAVEDEEDEQECAFSSPLLTEKANIPDRRRKA